MNANLILKTQQATDVEVLAVYVTWYRIFNISMTQYIWHLLTILMTKANSQNVKAKYY
jgi:hypothetical protein